MNYANIPDGEWASLQYHAAIMRYEAACRLAAHYSRFPERFHIGDAAAYYIARAEKLLMEMIGWASR